jgi:hypothetical protein
MSGRRWRAGRGRSGSTCTTTTASASRPEIEAKKASGCTWWESLDQMLARVDIRHRARPAHARHLPPALGAAAEAHEARRRRWSTPPAARVVDENALTRMLLAG